ncbi:MAG: hypothetical protein ACOWWM_09320 [Desulfobacterales bacterium]
MASYHTKHGEKDGMLTAKEMRAELRHLGYRLTGRENDDELRRMLQEELNRQWMASASRGKVIRRKRQ